VRNELTNSALLQRRLAVTPRGAPTLADFFVGKAKNSEVWDIEGRRYIDFAGGVGVLNTGHLHPRVCEAVKAQNENFSHMCYTVAPYEQYVAVAEKLTSLAPIRGAKKACFLTTGVEAVENAIKIARAATGRPAVIAFAAGFHGRTLLGMALTGKMAPYKMGFGPFPSEIFHVPFPSHGVSVAQSLNAIEQLFATSVESSRVAALIIEPVQGEGGFNIAPPEFLVALRALCDRHGIVFVADEIQAGFARTGKWFAIEHSRVEPDLITVAKSLAGGYPLSAVVGKTALMDAPEPGGLGGTYAGNPIGLAAARAVIEVIENERLLERSTRLGNELTSVLKDLQRQFPQITDVRGLGSMIAAEFGKAGHGPVAFDAVTAKAVQREAMQRGLILLTCGVGANAVRFLYPLTIENDVFAEAMDILRESVRVACDMRFGEPH
jgi:4-aminobutyrate aminotransferase